MKLVPNLRLTVDALPAYASRYSYGSEDGVIALVSKIRERGFLTKEELVVVGDWKSPRIRSRIARNSGETVREVTRLALETRSVQLAVHIPQALLGVGMPVASTLLHWFHQDPFPILDFRALWSLGIEMPAAYSLDFWEGYVGLVRGIAVTWKVDMRTLDKALWQFSAEHQRS